MHIEPVTGSASAHGLATYSDGVLLDAWYPSPVLDRDPLPVLGIDAAQRHDEIRGVEVRTITTVIEDLQAPPADAADAYLRLHLLSHRLVQPRSINLDGVFGLLANVAWTTRGPVAIDQIDAARMRARSHGEPLNVLG
ncbi:MAG: 2,3,4,5-tetrahydropyridine-2,6-dicarboxylate N-succinyltransferase, partial [Candidatus Nanopelagicales bacterium]